MVFLYCLKYFKYISNIFEIINDYGNSMYTSYTECYYYSK